MITIDINENKARNLSLRHKKKMKIVVTVNERKKVSHSYGVNFLLLGAPDFRLRICVGNEMLDWK